MCRKVGVGVEESQQDKAAEVCHANESGTGVVCKGYVSFNRGQHYLKKLSRSTLLRQNGNCRINRKAHFTLNTP